MNAKSWKQLARRFKYNDHDIYYWEGGQGPTLLLVHGFPTSSWDWAPLWEALTSKWHVIALDMLGYGFSDKPKGIEYSTNMQTDIHQALLALLGVHTFTILSHDYGDTIGQELVRRHNALEKTGQTQYTIHSWCLLNGGIFIEAVNKRPIQKLLLNTWTGPIVSKLMSKRRFSKSFSAVFAPDKQPSKQELDDFWWIISHHDGHRISHKLAQYLRERHNRRDEWVEAMQQTNIPMRFICGLLDPVSGENIAKRYMALMPNPDLIELPDVGHYPQVEASDRVLKAFEDFAQKHLPD